MAEQHEPGRSAADGRAVRHDLAALGELIQVAREGAEFYGSAARKVKDDSVRGLLNEMATARAQLVEELARHVTARGGHPPAPQAIGGRLRRLYADLLARTADDRDAAYVAELEEVEDGLLEAFEDATADAQAPEIRRVLEQHLPRVRAAHDRIRGLKRALH